MYLQRQEKFRKDTEDIYIYVDWIQSNREKAYVQWIQRIYRVDIYEKLKIVRDTEDIKSGYIEKVGRDTMNIKSGYRGKVR